MNIICQREPKRLEIHLCIRTTGLPKGLKVLGDGVVILAVQKRTLANKAGGSENTSIVMGAEREVPQPCNLPVNKCLPQAGIKKLTALGESSKTQKLKVWDLMLDKELHIMAYESIKSKSGALTPGTDTETLDGFSIEKIEETIRKLKDHTFQFRPSRRIYIPKPNGKERPLGIPSPQDKVVQKVMAIILEAIYDDTNSPKFLDCSHGFRRGRSTHTALKRISQVKSIDWMIEGDIKGYFDNINHKKLEELLCRYIEDQQFIDLYWKAVRAGYVDMASGKLHYGIIGVPQGGVLSPILSNIYLHELDMFLMSKIKANEEKNIPISLDHPEYRLIHVDISNARQAHLRAINRGDSKFAEEKLHLIKKLEKERHKLPSKITNPEAVQISYVRYADDFVIAIRGTLMKAAQVKEEVTQFLQNELKLELNQEKTLITDIKKSRAKFLGADIRAYHSRTSDTKKTQRIYGGYSRKVRVPSGKTILLAPLEKLVKKLEEQGTCRIENFALRKIIPTRKTAWVNLEVTEIITKFNQVWQGILNYYSFAYNRCQLNLIQYILQHSAACTLMNKLRLRSRRAIFKKFGKSLKVEITEPEPNTKIGAKKRKSKVIEFKIQPTLSRLEKFNTSPVIPFETFYWNLRTRTKLMDCCSVCGSSDRVEMHHIKAIKQGKTNNSFASVLSNQLRKQTPLCKGCHTKVHKGEYDGLKLNKIKNS